MGLPTGVTAQPVEITKESKEAVFTVVTTDKSPVGLSKNVFCTVVVTQDGEPITHTIASGSIFRIDPPRSNPTTAPASVAAQTAVMKTSP
jgi:hypothetical protein